MNFLEFTQSNLRNAWIDEPGLSIYVRRSIHPSRGEYELATINADSPGSGALTAFLDIHESQFQFFVENVMDKRLADFLKRRGYVKVWPNDDVPDCVPSCWLMNE